MYAGQAFTTAMMIKYENSMDRIKNAADRGEFAVEIYDDVSLGYVNFLRHRGYEVDTQSHANYITVRWCNP